MCTLISYHGHANSTHHFAEVKMLFLPLKWEKGLLDQCRQPWQLVIMTKFLEQFCRQMTTVSKVPTLNQRGSRCRVTHQVTAGGKWFFRDCFALKCRSCCSFSERWQWSAPSRTCWTARHVCRPSRPQRPERWFSGAAKGVTRRPTSSHSTRTTTSPSRTFSHRLTTSLVRVFFLVLLCCISCTSACFTVSV